MIDTVEKALDEDTKQAPEAEDGLDGFDALRKRVRQQIIGGGLPYLLITADVKTSTIGVENHGFRPEAVPTALRSVADTFEEAQDA